MLNILKRTLLKIISLLDLLNLYMNYWQKKIDKNHFEMRKLWFKVKTPFQLNKTVFYQTHPDLKLEGIRPTLARINSYGLLDIISENSVILDIGGNTGFMSMYFSKYAKHIDMVEMDDKFVRIAHLAKKHLGIQNYQIHNIDIKSFNPNKKYDVIISTAIHKWVGLNLEDYYELISSWLTTTGTILFESHANKEDIENIEYFLNTREDLTYYKGYVDDQLGSIRAYFLIRHKESKE